MSDTTRILILLKFRLKACVIYSINYRRDLFVTVMYCTEPNQVLTGTVKLTERMIEEADFVLLVCSPQLYGCLSQAKSSPLIHTAVAVISGAAIANLCSISTDSSKFIPVFLNQNVDRKFVPNSLKSHKVYELINNWTDENSLQWYTCWQISSRNTRIPWSKWSWDQGSVRVGGLSQTIDLQTRIWVK